MYGIRCEHEPALPAGECVATMVGSHNVEHFFVGTQDLELRKRLRKVLVEIGLVPLCGCLASSMLCNLQFLLLDWAIEV